MIEGKVIAVVLPAFNAEKTLKSCIQSILDNAYKNYELIIVDNNSTDQTKNIIKDFQVKNKIIKYIFEPETSRGAARNTGEKTAKGKIVLMTDSDCIVPNNWIKEMIKPIINKESDAVQGFELNKNQDFWSRQQQKRVKEAWNKNEKSRIIGQIDTKNFAISYKTLKEIDLTSRKYKSGNDFYLSIMLEKKNKILKKTLKPKVKKINKTDG